MDGDFLIRPLQPGEEQDYLDLYNYAHPVSMSGEYWFWRNTMSPAGCSMIETAWDGGRLVGAYGLVPVKLSAGGKTVYGGFSDIAVTHPDYRYRGIFSALGKSLYRRAGEAGIKFVYGFPTEHSRHGFQKNLGWELVRECRMMACWGCGGAGRAAESMDIDSAESIGDEFDTLWKRLESGPFRGNILAVRDREYLKWRFIKHPENRYRIFIARDVTAPAGYMAVRQLAEAGEAYADIVDIMAVDVHCFRELAGFALEYFRAAGCIRIRLPAGGIFYQSAMGLGFREAGIKYYFGCRTPESVPGFRQSWYYTMADAGEM